MLMGQMQGAGADIDADSALRALSRHMSLLQPQPPPEDAYLEAATPFSDISGRFSLSGGHRYGPASLLQQWYTVCGISHRMTKTDLMTKRLTPAMSR